eukprot:TRINITY_DN9744_c0_g2_i1.p1 TRINITY_DN9744_c0_g2~~TRINITY_DN9744_c0_g2_i1.p1  ORF type:complete len:342 (-),score=55.80 TRINITY_DN9744_c0_g2_i1:139-1116(-)
MLRSLVGSEMCIRDRYQRRVRGPCGFVAMVMLERVERAGPDAPPELRPALAATNQLATARSPCMTPGETGCFDRPRTSAFSRFTRKPKPAGVPNQLPDPRLMLGYASEFPSPLIPFGMERQPSNQSSPGPVIDHPATAASSLRPPALKQRPRKARECNTSRCAHNRQRSRCKDCGGRGICHHGRRRSQCRDCGGSAICEHGRRRSTCAMCGGTSVCQHVRQRVHCKECGGSQICEHNRQKHRCKECLARKRQRLAEISEEELAGRAVPAESARAMANSVSVIAKSASVMAKSASAMAESANVLTLSLSRDREEHTVVGAQVLDHD